MERKTEKVPAAQTKKEKCAILENYQKNIQFRRPVMGQRNDHTRGKKK